MKPSLKNRIRSYTRWPNDRDERIAAAKTEISAAVFMSRIGVVSDDIFRRATAAASRLEEDGVGVSQWE